MSEFNPDNIDPKAFFAEQARIYGAEHREAQTYKRFCRAVGRILKTREGQHMLIGLQQIVQFSSSSFRAEDGYNPHAAACRDGAKGVIHELLVASQIDNANHNPTEE